MKCIICLFLIVVPAAYAPPLVENNRRLTVLAYMCGSNLESASGAVSTDIREMLSARVDTESVSTLIMTGKSQLWYNDYSADALTVHEVTRRSPVELDRLEPTSMGESTTLSGFIDYGIHARPADNCVLIIPDEKTQRGS